MPVSRPTLRSLALPGILLAGLAGCATQDPCIDNPDYLAARNRPPLDMPEGVTGSERLTGGAAMTIPPADPNPAVLDPAPRCLDQPPPYFGKKVAAGSAEEAVYVWAAAWANRKPEQVAAFYSPQFATTDKGGATAYIADLRKEVADGPAADARLDELKSQDGPGGQKVVTFIQRFGRDAYLKELTLAKDAQGWRIVAERTIKEI